MGLSYGDVMIINEIAESPLLDLPGGGAGIGRSG